MPPDFRQSVWNPQIERDIRQLTRMAVLEDLDRGLDWTTVSLVPETARSEARIVARAPGRAAGLLLGPIVLDEMHCQVQWQATACEAGPVGAGDVLAVMSGNARDMLTAERTVLNFLGRMCGIATATSRFVERLAGTAAHIYDTRKTLPGWRSLDKYAVVCGGGRNHRHGLYDAILIKDNHLALGGPSAGEEAFAPHEAVQRVKAFVAASHRWLESPLIEIELDSVDHLPNVLDAGPDIVLLDNFSLAELRPAVKIRQDKGSTVAFEASGNVTLESVRAIAETGVERISSGSLTHSVQNFDLGLDWVA